MTKIMEDVLGVNPLRQYLVFTRVPETCWGLMGGIAIWDSKTRLWTVNGESASKHPSSGAPGPGLIRTCTPYH